MSPAFPCCRASALFCEGTEVLDREQFRVLIFLSGAVAFAKSTASKPVRGALDDDPPP